jgi:hypothetical protein
MSFLVSDARIQYRYTIANNAPCTADASVSNSQVATLPPPPPDVNNRSCIAINGEEHILPAIPPRMAVFIDSIHW